MNILGFVYHRDTHDTSAALVRDGVLVASAEEERFTRRKHESALPLNAIDFCLRQAGLAMSAIDEIAFPDTPFRTGRASAHAEASVEFLKRLSSESGKTKRRTLLHKYALDAWSRLRLPEVNLGLAGHSSHALSTLRNRYGRLPPIRFVDHHRSHAAAAYLTSGMQRAAVVTIDGRGGNYSTVGWHADGNDLRRVIEEPYTNSLGFFYESCTEYLGFRKLQSGKTMGLAPYGNADSARVAMEQLLGTTGPELYRYKRPPDEGIAGFPARVNENPLAQQYVDFAAAAQAALEQAIVRVAEATLAATGEVDLCVGGGVAYNCTANGVLVNKFRESKVWVFPASGDSGLSAGAALYRALKNGERETETLATAYFGPSFDSSEIESVLRSEPHVVFSKLDNVPLQTAELLASGSVIGWFQGRMELGPRALGARSILADPRSTSTRDRVNRIKRREHWRPLAPVVHKHRAAEYFEMRQASPFMLFAAQVKPEVREALAGIVHVDGSARPQTVSREQNQLLFDLLGEFERLSGHPVLLNTSFNDASEPIVCSPMDALRTFVNSDLDALVMGEFLIKRVKS